MLDDEGARWGEGLSEDGLRPMDAPSVDVLDRVRKTFGGKRPKNADVSKHATKDLES